MPSHFILWRQALLVHLSCIRFDVVTFNRSKELNKSQDTETCARVSYFEFCLVQSYTVDCAFKSMTKLNNSNCSVVGLFGMAVGWLVPL